MAVDIADLKNELDAVTRQPVLPIAREIDERIRELIAENMELKKQVQQLREDYQTLVRPLRDYQQTVHQTQAEAVEAAPNYPYAKGRAW